MLFGPIFNREVVLTPRRPQHFINRTVYGVAIFVLMSTAWLVVTGSQWIRTVSDMSRFGGLLFALLAPLQLAILSFLAAVRTANSVALEKDKKTLVLLLMTRLTNRELILGKLFASCLEVLTLLLISVPPFALITLLGGVSYHQVGAAFLVTAVTVIAAGSLGCMIGYWREKTFQTLAITALGLVGWVGSLEAVNWIAGSAVLYGRPVSQWLIGFSPIRAILETTKPMDSEKWLEFPGNGVLLYLVFGSLLAGIWNAIGIARVRVWNPNKEAQPRGQEEESGGAIWGQVEAGATEDTLKEMRKRELAEAQAGHVDSGNRAFTAKSREVWDNPILWRETSTWAYGRKVVVIRAIYLLLAIGVGIALYGAIQAERARPYTIDNLSIMPQTAKPLGPFFLLSLVILNALAVTSITNERDGGALDLLLVTDLTPREFLFGKIAGVAYATKEMILAPLALCLMLWWYRGVGLESLIYLLLGLVVMNLFVIVLGIHCGMTYANSRSAIGVSLGSVFFLFLGVVTLLVMMVSFAGSFQTQLAPFLAFILGGSTGLFAAWGVRNPSPAIALASVALPFATFFAVTSFLLEQPLQVFIVMASAYAFTVLAMLMPALGEFDFAMGRSKGGGE